MTYTLYVPTVVATDQGTLSNDTKSQNEPIGIVEMKKRTSWNSAGRHDLAALSFFGLFVSEAAARVRISDRGAQVRRR